MLYRPYKEKELQGEIRFIKSLNGLQNVLKVLAETDDTFPQILGFEKCS